MKEQSNFGELLKVLKDISEKINNTDCSEIQDLLKKIKFSLQKELQEQTDGLRDAILERDRIERKLSLFYQGTEQSADAVVITDLEGKMIYVNKQFVEVTGYSFNEAIGKNPRILKSGEHPQSFYKTLWDTITSGNIWKGIFHNKKKNGDLYWEEARIFPIFGSDGTITNYGAVKQDVTSRVETEKKNKQLLESQKVTNMLLNSATTNCTAEHIHSVSLENLLHLKWLGINGSGLFLKFDNNELNISSEVNLSDELREILLQKILISNFEEITHQRKVIHIISGEEFLGVELNSSYYFIPVSTSDKQFGAIILFTEDDYEPHNDFFEFLNSYAHTVALVLNKKISESKLAEAKRKLEEEVATKDKFFSIISHDLRSPFTALLGYTRMLDEDFESFSMEEIRESITSLHRTSENLFELLEGLLMWSRAQRGKLELNLEIIDLNAIINNLFELMFPVAEKKGIQLINETLPNTEVYADPDMLRGIIRNLISNSVKFTKVGGRIIAKHFSTEDEDIISIEDTGI